MKKRQWIKFNEAKKVEIDQEDKRNLYTEAPLSNRTTVSFAKVLYKTPFHICGSPTALFRYTGNPHFYVSELRSAVYFKLGIRQAFDEVVAKWNLSSGKTEWITTSVTPNDKYVSLLEDAPVSDLFC